ncbi:MAG: hypothetical protein AAGA55_10800 [Planctomycetota bacterium]
MLSRTGIAFLCFCSAVIAQGSEQATPTGDQQTTPDDAYALMDLLPSRLDVVAALNAPGRLSARSMATARDPNGAASATGALLDWVRGLGLLTETSRSWSALSERLGMSEAQAASELLGGDVVIGWERAAAGGLLGALGAADRGWIMVGTVSDPAADRLRSRLDAVPRRISSEYAVYTVDTGQVGMALIRGSDAWRFVLAPARNADLVDEALRRFRSITDGVAPPTADDAASDVGHAQLARRAGVPLGPDWLAAVLVRSAMGQPSPLVITAHGHTDTLTVRFGVAGLYRSGAPVAVLDQAGDDALLTLAMAGEPWNGSDAIILLPQPLNAGEDAPIRFPEGFTMVLGQPGSADSSQLSAIISGRAVSDAAFGAGVDRTVSNMIGGAAPPAHRGRFPGAVRTHEINTSPGEEDAGPWASGRVSVAWCFEPDRRDLGGIVSIAIGDVATDVASLAHHGRAIWTGAEANRPGSPGADIVMQGTARPSELMQATGADRDPLLGLLGEIEHAHWEVRQDGAMLRGEISVRVRSGRARLGGG